MSLESVMTEFQTLKLAEAGAIGSLAGCVWGFLLAHDAGVEPSLKQWVHLRQTYAAYDRAHNAFVDHLCQPLETLTEGQTP